MLAKLPLLRMSLARKPRQLLSTESLSHGSDFSSPIGEPSNSLMARFSTAPVLLAADRPRQADESFPELFVPLARPDGILRFAAGQFPEAACFLKFMKA